MNKLKLTLVSAVIAVTGSLLGMQVAGALHTLAVLSGTNCEAANLNQAALGMSWSQAGVVNNSTIPLFVVCPLDYTIAPSTTHSAPFVGGRFPGSGTIACIVRGQSYTGTSYVSAVLNITSGQNVADPNAGYNFAILPIPASTTNSTAVCALDPGEGIAWLSYH